LPIGSRDMLHSRLGRRWGGAGGMAARGHAGGGMQAAGTQGMTGPSIA